MEINVCQNLTNPVAVEVTIACFISLISFSGGEQLIASKSGAAFIGDICGQVDK